MIEERYAAGAKNLADGLAMSYDEYRFRVGYLTALRHVGKWSEEVTKSLDAKPPMRDA